MVTFSSYICFDVEGIYIFSLSFMVTMKIDFVGCVWMAKNFLVCWIEFVKNY